MWHPGAVTNSFPHAPALRSKCSTALQVQHTPRAAHPKCSTPQVLRTPSAAPLTHSSVLSCLRAAVRAAVATAARAILLRTVAVRAHGVVPDIVASPILLDVLLVIERRSWPWQVQGPINPLHSTIGQGNGSRERQRGLERHCCGCKRHVCYVLHVLTSKMGPKP